LLSLIRLIDWKRRSKCQWYFGEVVQGFWCDPCLDGNSEVNSVRRSKRCIIVERNITVPVKLYGLAQYSIEGCYEGGVSSVCARGVR
jgi:hypothetical protein